MDWRALPRSVRYTGSLLIWPLRLRRIRVEGFSDFGLDQWTESLEWNDTFQQVVRLRQTPCVQQEEARIGYNPHDHG